MASFVRWRRSGSKPPSSRQVRWTTSSHPIPAWPVAHGSPASAASGTASGCARATGCAAGRSSDTGSRNRSWRARPAGSRHGWCCHSSPSTRSTSPSASAGSACSGSASTSSQRSRGASAASAAIAGSASWSDHRPEAGDARAAGDRPGRRGEVGLGERGAVEQRLGVLGEHERRVGQPDAAPGALEQPDAGLALEHRELLGDRRGRELERVGDRGDRPALLELAQQPKSAEVEHRQATLPNTAYESASILTL